MAGFVAKRRDHRVCGRWTRRIARDTTKSDTDIMIAGQNVTLIAEESVIIAAEENLIVSSGAEAQIYLSEETGDANLIAPGMVKFDAEGGSPLEPFSRTISVEAVPEPEPEPTPSRVPRWLRVVGAIALAVVVTAVVVKTGGAALALVAKAGKAKKAKKAAKAMKSMTKNQKKRAARKAKKAAKKAAERAKKCGKRLKFTVVCMVVLVVV